MQKSVQEQLEETKERKLREIYVGQAINGILSNYTTLRNTLEFNDHPAFRQNIEWENQVANLAAYFADAALEERKEYLKKQENATS